MPDHGEPGFEKLPRCFGKRATILGTPGDDRIFGTRHDDVIVTFGGADQVSGLHDWDRVCTGAGADTVADADHWQVWLDLGLGNDLVRHVRNVGWVRAGAGSDRVTLDQRAVDVSMGPGDDTVRVLDDKPQRWAVNTPCVSFDGAERGLSINLRKGWAHGQGHDRLVHVRCVRTGRFSDDVVGTAEGDEIDVGAGDSRVWSRGGHDVVYTDSGAGADVFYLGTGNDASMPGEGPDRVYGGPGKDFIEAAGGADYLEGDDGNDTLHAGYRCDFGNSGGAGTVDTMPNELFGGPGNDYLTGDLGNDRLDGGPGLDRGQGGYRDGRIDWIESLERIVRC